MTPAACAKVGDGVWAGGEVATVANIITRSPGDPSIIADDCPLQLHHVWRIVHTSNGHSRFFSHHPGDRYRGVEILDIHPDGISFEEVL